MKKIGILYGMEKDFPESIIKYINENGGKGVSAEFIKIGALKNNAQIKYSVIFDRVSNNVPYYRSVLKLAALKNVRVINNPFQTYLDNRFFHAALSEKIKIKMPKTVVLPTKEHPYGTSSDFMRNLIYPLNWEEVFEYVGFPAILKPNNKNSAQNDYKVYNTQEFFSAYDITGSSVMILQECIDYQEYYRCYVVGKKHVKIMHFAPNKPHHLRYPDKKVNLDEKLRQEIEKTSIKLCKALGFDFNTIEFAIRNGKPYVLDFLNPSPIIEKSFISTDNYNWLVETSAKFLIGEAKKGKYKSSEYSWSSYLRGPK